MRSAISLFIIAFAYYAFAKLGLSFATLNSSASPFWPATGFGIWVVNRYGKKALISVAFGAFLANAQTDVPLGAAAVMAIGNMLEALCAHLIFNRIHRAEKDYGPVMFALAVAAASFVASMVSASVGVTSLKVFSVISMDAVAASWVTWWAGDVIGGLYVLPALSIFQDRARAKESQTVGTAMVLVVFACCWVLLTTAEGVPYLCFGVPLLLAFAYHAGRATTYAIALAIAASGIFFTKVGLGPFRHGTANVNLLNMQIFLGTVAVCVLFMDTIKRLGFVRYPLFILFGGALLGAIWTAHFSAQEEVRDQKRFAKLAAKNTELVRHRIEGYVHGLTGAVAHVSAKTASSPSDWSALDPESWRDFVSALNLSESYPGVHGLGIIYRVPSKDRARYLSYARSRIPGFSIHSVPRSGGMGSEGNRRSSEPFVITLLEPLASNLTAIGLDVSSESHRRVAAELAARNRSAALTRPITLVQDAKIGPAFLLYMPFYRGERHIGWVYAPFALSRFMESVTFESPQEIGYSISFSDPSSDHRGAPAYASVGELGRLGSPQEETTIDVAQQQIRMQWYRLPGFVSVHDSTSAWVSAMVLIISLATACLVANLQAVHARASAMALSMTRDLERHREAAQQASKMAALGNMAAGIAHEVNTPLAVIATHAWIIEKNLSQGEADVQELTSRIGKIKSTITRITQIIEGLKAFCGSGRGLPKKNTSIRTIVDGVLPLCQEKFLRNGVELIVDPIPQATIAVVEVQVEQVLMNLLSNALDAVSTFEQRWVRVGFRSEEGAVAITVTDSGNGIPKSVVDRMMEPFFTTKQVGKGMGLGLSISKGIMEEHGGELRYDEASAKTTFVMRLPLAKSGHSAVAA